MITINKNGKIKHITYEKSRNAYVVQVWDREFQKLIKVARTKTQLEAIHELERFFKFNPNLRPKS